MCSSIGSAMLATLVFWHRSVSATIVVTFNGSFLNDQQLESTLNVYGTGFYTPRHIQTRGMYLRNRSVLFNAPFPTDSLLIAPSPPTLLGKVPFPSTSLAEVPFPPISLFKVSFRPISLFKGPVPQILRRDGLRCGRVSTVCYHRMASCIVPRRHDSRSVNSKPW